MTPMPSQSQIDNAREALERTQMKLGKIQARAILSSATAKADQLDLADAEKAADKAQDEYRALVNRFTNADRIAEATTAIQNALGKDETRRGPLFGEKGVNGIEADEPAGLDVPNDEITPAVLS
jgi:hypothetical protein